MTGLNSSKELGRGLRRTNRNVVSISAFKGAIFVLLCFLVANLCSAQEKKLPFAVPHSPHGLPSFAEIETDKGGFEIEFFREEAPIAVRNFQYLAQKNFYKNLTFHRYEPGFVIQGGDPKGTGNGGPGYLLPPEFSNLKHERGTIGMARLPNSINPERMSNGSQFYICMTAAPHLDGLYTVFARVIRGMEIVDRLRKGDRIIHVKIKS